MISFAASSSSSPRRRQSSSRRSLEAERTYDAADREDAESAYADLQLVLDAGAERLAEIQAAYAATLEEDAAREYEAVFARAAAKRFPRFAAGL